MVRARRALLFPCLLFLSIFVLCLCRRAVAARCCRAVLLCALPRARTRCARAHRRRARLPPPHARAALHAHLPPRRAARRARSTSPVRWWTVRIAPLLRAHLYTAACCAYTSAHNTTTLPARAHAWLRAHAHALHSTSCIILLPLPARRTVYLFYLFRMGFLCRDVFFRLTSSLPHYTSIPPTCYTYCCPARACCCCCVPAFLTGGFWRARGAVAWCLYIHGWTAWAELNKRVRARHLPTSSLCMACIPLNMDRSAHFADRDASAPLA